MNKSIFLLFGLVSACSGINYDYNSDDTSNYQTPDSGTKTNENIETDTNVNVVTSKDVWAAVNNSVVVDANTETNIKSDVELDNKTDADNSSDVYLAKDVVTKDSNNSISSCVTPNAYYNFQYNMVSGDCGSLSDMLILFTQNIVHNRSPEMNPVSCDFSSELNYKCGQMGFECLFNDVGCTDVVTYITTFSADGSYGKTLEDVKVDCKNGFSCSSKYEVLITRE